MVTVGSNSSNDYLNLLPSTSFSQTMVVGADGCPKETDAMDFPGSLSCRRSRTVYDIPTNVNGQVYKIGDAALYSKYGFKDSEGLEWPSNITLGLQSSQPSIPSLVMAFNDDNYTWMGYLGLDHRPTYFLDQGGYSNGKPSMLQNLKDSKRISRLGWGYHVGKTTGKLSTKL
jgi:hypothetical protein